MDLQLPSNKKPANGVMTDIFDPLAVATTMPALDALELGLLDNVGLPLPLPRGPHVGKSQDWMGVCL